MHHHHHHHECCGHDHAGHHHHAPVVTERKRRQPKNTPLFQASYRAQVLRWLASEEPGLQGATRAHFADLAQLMTPSLVEALRRTGWTTETLDQFNDAWGQYVDRQLRPRWLAALQASREATGRPDIWATLTPQSAAQWLDDRAAQSLAGYTDRQQRTINTMLRGALAERLSQNQLTDLLRVSVGLTPQQAGALDKQTEALLEEGLDPALVNTRTALVAGQMQGTRASMIARTELASALNGSTQLAVESASRDGLLGEVQRVWVAQLDRRTCPICEGLNDTTAPLTQPFSGGYALPPAHPRCRCVVIYEEGAA